GYRDMVALMADAAVVVTDSGGLQEETTAMGIPCVTLRESTERPVTIEAGTNRMVPWPPTPEAVCAVVIEAARRGHSGGSRQTGMPQGWDGRAAVRVVDALEQAGRRRSSPTAS